MKSTGINGAKLWHTYSITSASHMYAKPHAPQQMILFPSWTTCLAPSQTPYALNFQGEPLHPTFLSVAYALAEESCQRKREHLSSSPASSQH